MKNLFLILSFLSCLNLFAQEQEDKIDSLLNDLIYSDTELMAKISTSKYHFIYAGVSASNKTYFVGREIDSDLLNINGSVFYFSSSGLFGGVSGTWYENSDPQYSTTTLTAGYGNYIDRKKQFRVSGSYSRFFYTNKDSAVIYPYDNNANLSFSFKKDWYGARISSNLLFGDESRLNFTPSIYSSFYFWKFGKSNNFHLGPEISCYFSSETINESSDNPKDVFGLLNSQLYIPFSLNLGNFEIQLSYALNIPFTQDNEINYKPSSSFAISAYYLIDLGF